MSKLTYKLYKNNTPVDFQKQYQYSQLIKMTTYQLKEICHKEKLIKNIIAPLDREELIHTIMRYRGKEEASFITDYQEEGLKRIEEFIQQVKWIPQEQQFLQVPSKIVLYEEIGIDYFDEYKIHAVTDLSEGNMLLVDEDYHICTIFNLREIEEGKYCLSKTEQIPIQLLGKKKYRLIYLEHKESELIYDLYHQEMQHVPTQMKGYEIPILEVRMKRLKQAHMPLIIDFGSSNTTVGIYEDEIKLVEVINSCAEVFTCTPLIPSCIAIKGIKEEQVEYSFGYEAILLEKRNYVEEEIPIFYDIKRWISDESRLEKITDKSGEYRWLKRSDLLKAYLNHIIDQAKKRFKYNFKEIQLLAPVKQKEKFEEVFKSLLENYQIRCELDEGVAVVFQSIYNLIKKGSYNSNRWYKALIIDCGGGTTDLTSCKFKIENNRVAYSVGLQTSYENGDINFGGNNLTYRTMQVIKIMLVQNLKGTKLWGDDLKRGKHFRQVDEEGKDIVYQKLQLAYEEAEHTIPTLFKVYEEQNREEYFKVKSNFYHLFDIAEKVKKYFFMGEGIYELNIGIDAWQGVDQREDFVLLDKWKIFIRDKNELIPLKEIKNIKVYWQEINSLLEADIYSLVKKFLEELFGQGELEQYEMIKLTGQSCKAPLFREALKEFIPGRLIQESKVDKGQYELKLSCIYGAIHYFKSKKLGFIDVKQTNAVGILPYEISSYTHEQKEKILIHSMKKEEKTGYISRYMEGQQLELYLKSSEGEVLKKYLYNHQDNFNATTIYEINEKYPEKIIQDETDNIVNGETKYFVWVAREEWGVYVLPIQRKEDILYIGEHSFFAFEDDTWEQNFFDGMK